MKQLLLIIAMSLSLFALEYSAKVEPLHTYTIFAATSGKVTYANESAEATRLDAKAVIKIDDELDRITLKTQQNLYANQKTIYDIQKANFDKIKTMKSKSDFEKDAERIKLFNQANALLATLQQIEQLKDQLSKKRVAAPGYYLKKLYVKKGAFVNPGMQLMDIEDISGSRLTLYVHPDDIKAIEKKAIYLNGKKSNYTLDKVFRTKDSNYISTYKVELVGDKVDAYGEVVTVTFK